MRVGTSCSPAGGVLPASRDDLGDRQGVGPVRECGGTLVGHHGVAIGGSHIRGHGGLGRLETFQLHGPHAEAVHPDWREPVNPKSGFLLLGDQCVRGSQEEEHRSDGMVWKKFRHTAEEV